MNIEEINFLTYNLFDIFYNCKIYLPKQLVLSDILVNPLGHVHVKPPGTSSQVARTSHGYFLGSSMQSMISV